MAYLSDHDWDIFISYAHNDKPRAGPTANWISHFKKLLEVRLNSISGEEYKIYFDEDAQRFNEQIGDILKKVKRSGVLLMIGSPNFVKSSWCRSELAMFRETFQDDTSRIFIAEIMPLRDGRSYPFEVPNNLRAPFWSEPKDGAPMTLEAGRRQFELTLAKLAQEICLRLEGLASGGPIPLPPPPPAPPPPPRPPGGVGQSPVFIAYGTEDVAEDRENLVSYLRGVGVSLVELPEQPPRTRERFDALVDEKLADAAMYVQLLSRRKSRPFEDDPASPTDTQFKTASARLPTDRILLWRPDDLDPEKNSDEAYKKMLWQAVSPSIPVLGKAIQDKLLEPPPPPPSRQSVRIVINAAPTDREFADEMMDACEGRTCTAFLDDYADDDGARRNWADATAVAFVHGRAPGSWLPARYMVFNRARADSGATSDPEWQVVLYAPPPPKRRGGIRTRGLEEYDVSDPWSVEPFEAWLDDIGARKIEPKAP